MKARSLWSWMWLTGMLLLSGCQRLNVETKPHVAVGAVHQIDISPPRFEQKVTAQISSRARRSVLISCAKTTARRRKIG
jgi:hypothetical protein